MTMFTPPRPGKRGPSRHGALGPADPDGNDGHPARSARYATPSLSSCTCGPGASRALREHHERLAAHEHGLAPLQRFAVRPRTG